MDLFRLLQVQMPELLPEQSKVHLAVFNGAEHPINVFKEGRFERWQAEQSKANFSRAYVVSLIRMIGSTERWLFAGVYRPLSVAPHPSAPKPAVVYETEPVAELDDLVGRVVVAFKNKSRQMVPYGESVAEQLEVAEIRTRRLSNLLFTGYYDVLLSKGELDRIVARSDPEWLGPLCSVKGIYLITDTATGRLYVGSAGAKSAVGGETGIWARWKQYSANGHGDNVKLRAALDKHGQAYAENFQFSILEVLPPQSNEEVLKSREGHWKRVLVSFKHGYNDNLERDIERPH